MRSEKRKIVGLVESQKKLTANVRQGFHRQGLVRRLGAHHSLYGTALQNGFSTDSSIDSKGNFQTISYQFFQRK